MSTRCNIIVKDDWGEIIFYRHSDGYPEGVKPTLTKLLDMLDTDLRNNVSQFSGWLVLIGAWEYEKYIAKNSKNFIVNHKYSHDGWKVGAYEPAPELSGDIEYLYIFDLEKKEIQVYKYREDYETGKVTKKLIDTWKNEVKTKLEIV